jgi:succinoglycan biosynthesis protein ExoA
VRNEAAFLGHTLQQLLSQHYHPDRYEIIVADGGSTDRTCEIVRELQQTHSNLHLLDNPHRWSSAGRNAAVQASVGDIIVLVDGHCELEGPDYLADLVEAFRRSGADCVGRPQPLDVSDATVLQEAIAAARASRLGHHPDSHIWSDREGFVPPQSVAVAYRREVFERVGLFDESFDACEDVEFNERVAQAGMRCFFTPRVRVRYYPRGTLGGLFRQLERYGRGRIRLSRKHPGTLSAKSLVPAAFLAGVILGPCVCLLASSLWWAYFGVLAVYALVVLAGSMTVSWQRRRPALLPLLPLVFVTVHMGAGWGLLRETLVGRKAANRRWHFR